MRAKFYTRAEVENLVDALEVHVREVHELAGHAAQQAASANSFHAYRAFRDKAGEFETFSILIEGRLNRMEDGANPDLQQTFDELTAVTYKELIRASIKFLYVLAAHASLPLGTREIFMQELRTLHDTKAKLSQSRYAERLDDEARRNLKVAEDILNEIIDKAPSLLSFGGR
ncbi:MAG: hypothetical protein HYR63_12150 [Proteobacteria bacterium]|nr:hypothetical protein [Pseudomonadota bacterium]MBI3500040.1 hypothetical protein [Pseudomonadota bacterium]